jgi:putative transposase
MAKAIRFLVPGCSYHLTHRCHNGDYLLRFARDRNAYKDLLRQYSKTYRVPVMGYCLTSNHVHLLVKLRYEGAVSEFMDALQGDFAQKYNLRKGRSGSFWNGRYHATAIESSKHLWECLRYIDLNMVRAGVVGHPSEWPWCSYPELSGTSSASHKSCYSFRQFNTMN